MACMLIVRGFHFFLMWERERERERERKKKERERDRKIEYLTDIVINSNNMDVNRRSSVFNHELKLQLRS